jgi:S1-C subfamily serine protease
MKLASAFVLVFILSSSPAFAAEWWYIGHSGAAPDRVITYVDRQTLAKTRGDELEMWVFNIAEKPTAIGIRAQAMKYRYRCDKRMLASLERVAYDTDGKVMPLASPAPEPFTPAVAGSIGETALNFACGRPAGIELKVDNAVDHALKLFAGAAQPVSGQRAAPEQESPLSLGTGFFIGPAGHVVTSYHVIDGAERIA